MLVKIVAGVNGRGIEMKRRKGGTWDLRRVHSSPLKFWKGKGRMLDPTVRDSRMWEKRERELAS